MAVTSVEEAKELLYGEAQDTFVSARDALVKELRQAKQRELAALVKALRKPSAVAAEVNRVVRSDPGAVELILQAADLLRAAQTGALDDDDGLPMSELQTQYRAAIKALAQTAASRKAEVRAALEAATIDVESNQALRTGSLVVVPEPVSVFESATSPPVDELAVRRARRQSEEVAEASASVETSPRKETSEAAVLAKEAADAAQAEQEAAAAVAAAAEREETKAKAAAAKAEKEAKRQLAQQRAALKKRHKDLSKQHRQALRNHLDALDTEAETEAALDEAATGVDVIDTQVVEIEAQIADLHVALAGLVEEKAQALTTKKEAAENRASATARAAQAGRVVAELTTAIAEVEAELSES